VIIDSAYKLQDKVPFDQFIGITSARYGRVFERERLKDAKGNFKRWDPRSAQPIVNVLIPSYLDVEKGAIVDISSSLPAKYKSMMMTTVGGSPPEAL
jgi:hypothetical protein